MRLLTFFDYYEYASQIFKYLKKLKLQDHSWNPPPQWPLWRGRVFSFLNFPEYGGVRIFPLNPILSYHLFSYWLTLSILIFYRVSGGLCFAYLHHIYQQGSIIGIHMILDMHMLMHLLIFSLWFLKVFKIFLVLIILYCLKTYCYIFEL